MSQQDASVVSVSAATSVSASAATSVSASSLEDKSEEYTNSLQSAQTEKADGNLSQAEEGNDEGTDAHLLNKQELWNKDMGIKMEEKHLNEASDLGTERSFGDMSDMSDY